MGLNRLPAQPHNAASPADAGNATAEAIIARLPDKPLVNAREVADALFLSTSRAVTDAIDGGELRAVRLGNQYRISRAEAARWIRTLGL